MTWLRIGARVGWRGIGGHLRFGNIVRLDGHIVTCRELRFDLRVYFEAPWWELIPWEQMVAVDDAELPPADLYGDRARVPLPRDAP